MLILWFQICRCGRLGGHSYEVTGYHNLPPYCHIVWEEGSVYESDYNELSRILQLADVENMTQNFVCKWLWVSVCVCVCLSVCECFIVWVCLCVSVWIYECKRMILESYPWWVKTTALWSLRGWNIPHFNPNTILIPPTCVRYIWQFSKISQKSLNLDSVLLLRMKPTTRQWSGISKLFNTP